MPRNGRILFEGKSNIDNQDIVVIITGLDNDNSTDLDNDDSDQSDSDIINENDNSEGEV